MKHIKEMERVGSIDGFDQLIHDRHKLAVLIAYGLFKYNGHIRVRFQQRGDALALWVDNDHSYEEYMAGLLEMLKLAGLHYTVSRSYAKATDAAGRTITVK